MKLVGKRYSYPMITTYAKKFTSDRFAVIGDAAVGLHPVTAHGFNLGLKGLEILISEIKTKENLAIMTRLNQNKRNILPFKKNCQKLADFQKNLREHFLVIFPGPKIFLGQ